MAAEADKALIRRLFEDVWNHGNIEVANEIVHERDSSIENRVFSSTPGPQIVAADVELYRSLYDELSLQIERTFTEGRTIMTIWIASGTSRSRHSLTEEGRRYPRLHEPKA